MKTATRAALAILALTALGRPGFGEGFDRKEDVVYGRKSGMALTMDVFTPKSDSKHIGLIYVVSGGWFSAHEAISPRFVTPFTDRGYTVFAVVHGSQPRFTIPEAVADMKRSVRYIRTHAKDFGIDPDHIGIYGGSAGGHLSLMIGTTGDDGNPNAPDPVERASSRVQAVACFFPPTDFLNYGKPGEIALGSGVLRGFKAPFMFNELDKSNNSLVLIVDQAERLKIGRSISPAVQVTPDDAPSLIFHGDADKLVPIQQAERIIQEFEKEKIPNQLVVRPGAGHGWPTLFDDLPQFADWFDKYLQPSKSSK